MIRLHVHVTVLSALAALLLALPGGAAAQAPGLPHIFSSGDPAVAGEVNENFREAAPANVIHVSSAAELSQAVDLTNAVYAAHGAPAADNPYVIKLAPGVYDLGTPYLGVPEYVDLEGAGRSVTVLRSGHVNSGNAAVRLGSNSELRFLTVQHPGGGHTVYGVSGNSATAVISHTTVKVTNDSGTAVAVLGPAKVRHSTLSATGTGTVGGYSSGFDGPNVLNDVDITLVSSSTTETPRAALVGQTAQLHDVRASVENSSTGDAGGIGVSSDTTATITDSEVRVTAPSGTATVLSVVAGATLTVHRSTLIAGDGTTGGENFYANIDDNAAAYLATSQLGGDFITGTTDSVIDCALVYTAVSTGFDGILNGCPPGLN